MQDEIPESLYFVESKISGGYIKVSKDFMYNKDISTALKALLPQILEYQRTHKYTVITKALCMQITGQKRRVVDRVYDEAERLGYMTQYTVDTDKYKKMVKKGYTVDQHTKIIYVWYSNPDINPKYIDEDYLDEEETDIEMQGTITRMEDVVEQFKAELANNKAVPETAEEKKIRIEMKKQRQVWLDANDKFNRSIFGKEPVMDVLLDVSMSTEMDEYFTNHFNFDYIVSQRSSIYELVEACWKLIVRASSNTQDSFEKLMRKDLSAKIMENCTAKMEMVVYKGGNLYKQYYSKIPIICEPDKYVIEESDIDYAKLLFVRFTQVIANYIRQKEFMLKDNGDRKVPNEDELVTLYFTLEAHPELICLNNNRYEYALFDRFFRVMLNSRTI